MNFIAIPLKNTIQSFFLFSKESLTLKHLPAKNVLGFQNPKTKNTDLPEWVSLFREDLEVFLSELDRGQRLQPEVGPTLDKLHQRLKGVQTQPIVAIVRQVGHEDTDLD